MKTIMEFKEQGFTVAVKPYVHGAAVGLEVFNIEAFEGETCQYLCKGDSNKSTTNIEEAAPMITGFIKWDGCAELKFFGEDNGQTHFCGRKDAMRLALIVNALYEIAKKHMKVIDNELYEGK